MLSKGYGRNSGEARVAEDAGEVHLAKVLLVEDDPISRRALARLLALEGFTVQTASTLAEADAKLDGQAVAVLDLNLPDGSATTLLKAIRVHHPHLRVVVLTAAADDLVADASAFSPDLVMRKPADVPLLLQWLQDWRQSRARARP